MIWFFSHSLRVWSLMRLLLQRVLFVWNYKKPNLKLTKNKCQPVCVVRKFALLPLRKKSVWCTLLGIKRKTSFLPLLNATIVKTLTRCKVAVWETLVFLSQIEKRPAYSEQNNVCSLKHFLSTVESSNNWSNNSLSFKLNFNLPLPHMYSNVLLLSLSHILSFFL